MEQHLILGIMAALFGLVFGSFLNVCITRLPQGESIAAPRSHCRSCQHMIAWYDNLPVLSFLLLRGRCRHCQASIPWRYPLVEILTAAWFVTAALYGGTSWATVKWCVFGFAVLDLAISDLETRWLPDAVTLGGWIAGLALAVVAPPPSGFLSLLLEVTGLAPLTTARASWLPGFAEALIASLLAAFLLWFIGWSYKWINRVALSREIDPLGEGDPLMLGLLAAFLGFEGVILALLIAGLSGTVLGVAWLRWKGEDASSYALPLGLFLGVGGLAIACAQMAGWLRF